MGITPINVPPSPTLGGAIDRLVTFRPVEVGIWILRSKNDGQWYFAVDSLADQTPQPTTQYVLELLVPDGPTWRPHFRAKIGALDNERVNLP